MLYSLIGNGVANKKEVVATLGSLLDTYKDEFWMTLMYEENPSETMNVVIDWVNRNNVYYELIADSSDLDNYQPQHVYPANGNALNKLINVIMKRPEKDEGRALLFLGNEINIDISPDEAEVFKWAKENGIDVFSLGSQLMPITIESEVQEPVPVVEAKEQEVEFTREDLESLTRDELKSMVASRGLVPRDMRSNTALIDCLLNASGEAPEVKVSETPMMYNETKTYYLTVVSADGTAEMRLLSPEQVRLLA